MIILRLLMHFLKSKTKGTSNNLKKLFGDCLRFNSFASLYVKENHIIFTKVCTYNFLSKLIKDLQFWKLQNFTEISEMVAIKDKWQLNMKILSNGSSSSKKRSKIFHRKTCFSWFCIFLYYILSKIVVTQNRAKIDSCHFFWHKARWQLSH